MEYDNLEGAIKRVDFVCNTAGDGLWSEHVAPVRCTKLEITYVASHDDEGEDLTEDAPPTFGELQVEFDDSWDPSKHGLIYTDRRWELELRENLMRLGFTQLAVDNIGYSEQGMQGEDYVSLDVGMVFLAEAREIFARGE